jgi:hypothetical protein
VTGSYISADLREAIRRQARDRCGYCLVSQSLLYGPLEFEHLVPRSAGGPTVEVNLWLACRLCNGFKGDQTAAIDPVSQRSVVLFDPRRNTWTDHFQWSDDGAEIVGLTEVGRATVVALQLNCLQAVELRRRWISVGWHPPKD